jgi:hypothetical protein
LHFINSLTPYHNPNDYGKISLAKDFQRLASFEEKPGPILLPAAWIEVW